MGMNDALMSAKQLSTMRSSYVRTKYHRKFGVVEQFFH